MRILSMAWRRLALVCSCLPVLGLVFQPGAARADWLTDFLTYAENQQVQAGIPGMAIAIVEGNSVTFAGGFGHLSQDPASAAVDADTVFNIGSCSKAFGATQIAILKDQGKIKTWNDAVSLYLPSSSFKMYDSWVNKQIQVVDLLTHRSGLNWYTFLAMPLLAYQPESQVTGVRYEKPDTSFRTVFAYQNNMYVAACKLIEAITGQTWKENLASAILQPLGMTRTVTSTQEKNQMTNVASGHLMLDNGDLWTIPPNWQNSFVSDYMLTAGAVKSTANDLARWVILHLNNGKFGEQQLVLPDTMQYAHAPLMFAVPSAAGPGSPYAGPVSYGLGWQYFSLAPQPLFTHDGTELGYKASILLIPGVKAGIVVLSNMGRAQVNDPVLNNRAETAQRIAFKFYDIYLNRPATTAQLEEFLQQVQKFNQGTPAPAPAGKRVPAVPLKNYCGVYNNPAYGNFTVKQSGDGLVIIMGPQQLQGALVPVGGNDFRASLPNYPTPYSLYIPFTFNLQARPRTMTMGAVMGFDQKEVFKWKHY